MYRVLAAAALALPALVLPAEAVHAQPATRNDHCVLHVLGQLPSGELLTSNPACYATFEEAMRSEGVDAWGEGAARAIGGVTPATFTIGTHYDGANYGGASTSVVGSDCNGGWLNVSAAWNNRISSTRNGCPRIRHFSGANLTGSVQDTFSPGGNLTSLDNATTSIQYAT